MTLWEAIAFIAFYCIYYRERSVLPSRETKKVITPLNVHELPGWSRVKALEEALCEGKGLLERSLVFASTQ